jgi:hypothetical protein
VCLCFVDVDGFHAIILAKSYDQVNSSVPFTGVTAGLG